jgi:hypothetical protein
MESGKGWRLSQSCEVPFQHEEIIMKKQLFVLLGLGMLVGMSAFAQTVNLKADVPFNFIIRGATLPAGEYTIQGMADGSAIAVRGPNPKANTIVLSQRCSSLDAAKQSKLVFHRYGDRYFLAQLWVAGSASGRQLLKSPREMEVARDYTVQDVVLFAALR